MTYNMDVESLNQSTTTRTTQASRSAVGLVSAIVLASLIGAATLGAPDVAATTTRSARSASSAPASSPNAIPSDLDTIAGGDQAFIQYALSGDALKVDAIANQIPAFDTEFMNEISPTIDGVIFYLAGMCDPDLQSYMGNSIPKIPSSIFGVDPRDVFSGRKTLRDILPAGVLDLDLHHITVLKLVTELTGLDLTNLDLAALLGPNAAMLDTVKSINIVQLQAALGSFSVPDIDLSSISGMVQDMGLDKFDLSSIQSMIGGFDVDAINLESIGDSMNQYKSITDMNIEELVDQVNAFAHGPGPMVEKSTRRAVRAGLTLDGTTPVLRVVREHHDIKLDADECLEILKNGTVYAGNCGKAWAKLDFEDHHSRVSGQESHLKLRADAQGNLYGSNDSVTDFEFGVLAMLPMSGNATIMEAAMPVVSYMMADPTAASSERGLDHLMADAMADIPAMMKLLPIVNVTLPEVMAGMKNPMSLLSKVLDTMDTEKLNLVIEALPELVAEDLGSILPILQDIDSDYDFQRMAEILNIITTKRFTHADIGDIKTIVSDLPSSIIPESFGSLLDILESIDDDLRLVRLVSLVKTIFDEYTLSLHISVKEVEEIVDMLPKSLANLLPSAVMDILAKMPEKTEVADLLNVLEYAVSRNWPKLQIKEFNRLIDLVPSGALEPLMEVMGMQVDVKAIQKLLGMFPKNTQLRTLLQLAGDAAKIDFVHATFGTLSKFFGHIDKELVNSLLSELAPGMTAEKIGTLLAQFPADLELKTILGFAKKLGSMDLENASIGEFLSLLSEVDANVLNSILNTLGMPIDINSITGLMSKVDPSMKISSALAMAKSVTTLDLTTATIGTLEGLLNQVGLPTVDGLLKSFNVPVTGTQISGILHDFPPTEELSTLLAEVKDLLTFMSGDVTQHTAGEFKSVLAHWKPVLVNFMGASQSSMLGMVSKVLDMFPADQSIATQIQTFDSLLNGLVNSSWDQAMKMLPMVPQGLWDAIGVDPSSIITMLSGLKSNSSIADIFDAIKSLDFSTMKVSELRTILLDQLHFDRYSIRNLSEAFSKILLNYIDPAKSNGGVSVLRYKPDPTLGQVLQAVDILGTVDWNSDFATLGKVFSRLDGIFPDLGLLMIQTSAFFDHAGYEQLTVGQPDGYSLFTCREFFTGVYQVSKGLPYPATDTAIKTIYEVAERGYPKHMLALVPDLDLLAGKPIADLDKVTGTKFGSKLAECSVDQLKQWSTFSPAPPATCGDILGDPCTCESVTTYINITSDITQADLDTMQTFYLNNNCIGEAKKEAIAAKKAMDAANKATLKQKTAAKKAAHKAAQEEAARKEAKHQAILSEKKQEHKKEVAAKKEALRQKHLQALSEAKQQHKQDLLDQQAAADKAAEEKRLAILSEEKEKAKLETLAEAKALAEQDAEGAAEAKRLAVQSSPKKEKKKAALAQHQLLSDKKHGA